MHSRNIKSNDFKIESFENYLHNGLYFYYFKNYKKITIRKFIVLH